jgi:hypothetical protein
METSTKVSKKSKSSSKKASEDGSPKVDEVSEKQVEDGSSKEDVPEKLVKEVSKDSADADKLIEAEISEEDAESVGSMDDTSSIDSTSVAGKEEGEFSDLLPHEQVDYLLLEISAFKHALQNMNLKLKILRKSCKSSLKKPKKQKTPNPNSGVMKMFDVPDNVTAFLEKDSSEQVSRRDLLTGVCNYVRDNKLQNPAAKREFQLDSNMKTVLCKRKNKETKEYEDITEDKLMYTQIMGAISYWFDAKVDHTEVVVSSA